MKKQAKTFREVLAEIESSQDIGQGSWALPENPTVLQQAKYDICQKMIRYKRNKHITVDQLTQQINSNPTETENVLHCRLPHLSLDKLMDFANNLFSPCQVEITIKEKNYVRAV
jgi:hypothetical protein